MKVRYSPTMRQDYNLREDDLRRIIADGRARRADFRDEVTGEIDATLLAEAIAHDLGGSHWLDDDTHPVWDVAAELAGA